jgi:hypothetical protein
MPFTLPPLPVAVLYYLQMVIHSEVLAPVWNQP